MPLVCQHRHPEKSAQHHQVNDWGVMEAGGFADGSLKGFWCIKSEAKWASQMAKRGWTLEQITEALANGKTVEAVNFNKQR
jgi:hypothetical protein